MPEPREVGMPMRELNVGQGIKRGVYQDRLREALPKELAAGQGIRRRLEHGEAAGASTLVRARVGRPLVQAAGKGSSVLTPALREAVSRELAAMPGLRRGLYHPEATGSSASARMSGSLMRGGGKGSSTPTYVLRQARARKSPLPAWYPRTPLRDISALVNAIERRRVSLSSSAREQINQYNKLSPPSALTVSPLPRELCASDTDLIVIDSFDNSPSLVTANVSSSATESLPRTPYVPASAVPEDQELVKCEAKLEKSIDSIEKIIRENLNRKPKVSVKKTTQQTTLMSLR